MTDLEFALRVTAAMGVVSLLYSGIMFAIYEWHPRSQEGFNVGRWFLRVVTTTALACLAVVLIVFSYVEQQP